MLELRKKFKDIFEEYCVFAWQHRVHTISKIYINPDFLGKVDNHYPINPITREIVPVEECYGTTPYKFVIADGKPFKACGVPYTNWEDYKRNCISAEGFFTPDRIYDEFLEWFNFMCTSMWDFVYKEIEKIYLSPEYLDLISEGFLKFKEGSPFYTITQDFGDSNAKPLLRSIVNPITRLDIPVIAESSRSIRQALVKEPEYLRGSMFSL